MSLYCFVRMLEGTSSNPAAPGSRAGHSRKRGSWCACSGAYGALLGGYWGCCSLGTPPFKHNASAQRRKALWAQHGWCRKDILGCHGKHTSLPGPCRLQSRVGRDIRMCLLHLTFRVRVAAQWNPRVGGDCSPPTGKSMVDQGGACAGASQEEAEEDKYTWAQPVRAAAASQELRPLGKLFWRDVGVV